MCKKNVFWILVLTSCWLMVPNVADAAEFKSAANNIVSFVLTFLVPLMGVYGIARAGMKINSGDPAGMMQLMWSIGGTIAAIAAPAIIKLLQNLVG